MNQIFSRFIQNKHTSGAAIAYVAVVTMNRLGPIWFPQHQAQFDATAEVLKGAALSYGLLMAGDAQPQQTTTNAGETPALTGKS
jgi:hypothetical protein